MESIKYAIAKQELVQEKFDEKKIMYFLSKVPEGDRADINYMQRIVNTFINSVFVYEDRVVICHNFDGDEARSPLKKYKFHMPSSYQKERNTPNGVLLRGAARQSKSEPFLLLIASCNSAKVMVFVPSL